MLQLIFGKPEDLQLYVAGKVYFYEVAVEFVDADISFLGWITLDGSVLIGFWISSPLS